MSAIPSIQFMKMLKSIYARTGSDLIHKFAGKKLDMLSLDPTAPSVPKYRFAVLIIEEISLNLRVIDSNS